MQEKNREFSILKERIVQYLEYKGINRATFYKESGIANGVFSQSNGISEDNLLKFLNICSDINADWLLFGRGEMEQKENQQIQVVPVDNIFLLDRIEKLAAEKEVLRRRIEELEVIQMAHGRQQEYSVQDVQTYIAAETSPKLKKE
jgi:hypothetical protein